jgi:hypothetical protein
MVFGSPSQSDLKKSVQLCALRPGRGSRQGEAPGRARLRPSRRRPLYLVLPKNSDRHWKTRTTGRCLRCRRNRGSLIVPISNSSLLGWPKRECPKRAACRRSDEASPWQWPTRQAAPLTLKVACMASPSRFDRREDCRCNSTNLQTFGILQTMLASNFALNDLRAIQIWPK